MHPKTAEKMFKTIFFVAILAFMLVVIGLFLLIVKILLLFTPEIHLMGMTIIM